ncbi:polysaccharide export outer membrane protein [Salinisphaera sp. T31B1]
MFGQPDMTTTGYISPDGDLSLPLIDQVHVGGLTPNQAQKTIAEAYRRGGYFANPQVSITITEYRSRQISVLGEVRRPGRYPMKSRTDLLDAIAGAEGMTPQASRDVIVIRRADGDTGTQRYTLNIDDLVSGRASTDDFTLAGGDTVFVPEAPLFYIYGEVQRPDAYALRPGMTLIQAISTGGGLTERGSNSRIVIHRDIDGQPRTIDPQPDTVVEPRDTIFVKERIF